MHDIFGISLPTADYLWQRDNVEQIASGFPLNDRAKTFDQNKLIKEM